VLTDNSSPHIARESQIFARQIGLKPCFTPVRSEQNKGISLTGLRKRMAFARSPFVWSLKHDYVEITPAPDARTIPELIDS